jgi:hypothetical protein
LAPPAASEPSPQHFAVEIKFGPYVPDIDSEFDADHGVFGALFGKRDEDGNLVLKEGCVPKVKAKLKSTFEFDWQFWRFKGGSLGLWGSVGFMMAKGKTLLPEDSGSLSDLTCPDGSDTLAADLYRREAAGDNTSLYLLPFSGGIVFRADYFAEELNIPLVPYVKGGFAYTFYWITDGLGDIASFGTDEDGDEMKARGGIPGFEVDAGLAILLDWFDPDAADDFDESAGINNSYLFGEFHYVNLNGFGKRMNLGDITFNIGLAMEF